MLSAFILVAGVFFAFMSMLVTLPLAALHYSVGWVNDVRARSGLHFFPQHVWRLSFAEGTIELSPRSADERTARDQPSPAAVIYLPAPLPGGSITQDSVCG